MKSKSVHKNIEFLNRNDMIPQFRKNGGNVVTISYLGESFYVGLEQFKFRRAGTSNWIQKTHRIFGVNDIIKIPRGFRDVPKEFRNKKPSELIEEYPLEVENFLYTAPVLFRSNCIEKLKDIDLEFESAMNFVMPFGKYQGLKLNRILDFDINYLEWIYVNFKDTPTVYSKVETVLEKTDNL